MITVKRERALNEYLRASQEAREAGTDYDKLAAAQRRLTTAQLAYEHVVFQETAARDPEQLKAARERDMAEMRAEAAKEAERTRGKVVEGRGQLLADDLEQHYAAQDDLQIKQQDLLTHDDPYLHRMREYSPEADQRRERADAARQALERRRERDEREREMELERGDRERDRER